MPKQRKKTYKKSSFHFEELSDEKTKVLIDDTEFDVYCDPKTKKFSTVLLPYVEYDNLDDLVKGAIDNHPDFRK